MSRPTKIYVLVLIGVNVFLLGVLAGAIAFDRNTAIDLAPNGMAYCPADTSTPHPTPCMFRQP